MKFNHEFKEALLREGFPPYWVESAVPYGQLKKVIKKVKNELETMLKEIGLEPDEFVSAQIQSDARGSDGSVVFQYNFDGDEVFRPKLTLYFEGDQPVDATLSPNTREYLRTIVANRKRREGTASEESKQELVVSEDSLESVNQPFNHFEALNLAPTNHLQQAGINPLRGWLKASKRIETG